MLARKFLYFCLSQNVCNRLHNFTDISSFESSSTNCTPVELGIFHPAELIEQELVFLFG